MKVCLVAEMASHTLRGNRISCWSVMANGVQKNLFKIRKNGGECPSPFQTDYGQRHLSNLNQNQKNLEQADYPDPITISF